jgi:hypothetical protein
MHSQVCTFDTQISCIENTFDTQINVLMGEVMNATQISHLPTNPYVKCVFNAQY